MGENNARPDQRGLDVLALAQGGYFDRRDAADNGLSDRLIYYHVHTGRFERVFPGVYRLSVAPISPHDDLWRAWIWSNYRGAISHESALQLFGLSDAMPSRVQLTVPSSVRRKVSGQFDVYVSDLAEEDTVLYDGLRATSPARSIVDAARVGTGPEQIALAVRQAVARGLASPAQLQLAASRAHYRWRRTVLPLIERAVADAVK
jgi:predicted transcriptional regulator of viral defense system